MADAVADDADAAAAGEVTGGVTAAGAVGADCGGVAGGTAVADRLNRNH